MKTIILKLLLALYPFVSLSTLAVFGYFNMVELRIGLVLMGLVMTLGLVVYGYIGERRKILK